MGCASSSSGTVQHDVCSNQTAHVKFASIRETRSTNSPEILVDLYCDGSAERTLGAPGMYNLRNVTAKSFPANSQEVLAVLANVNAVGDVTALGGAIAPVDRLEGSPCAKSVSFGTLTTITVGASTSGDLQCLASPSAAATALFKSCAILAPTTNGP